MVPSLVPGDKLLLAPLWRRPRTGEMVAFDDPEQPDRLLVKRVGSVSDDGVEVSGDNEGASRDSRVFGRVPLRSVRGRAVYRYAPATRAGWL
jgi:nickel-type superoxide dismutase maturation protease